MRPFSSSCKATRWFRNLVAALRNQDGYTTNKRMRGQFNQAHVMNSAGAYIDDLRRHDLDDVPVYKRLG